MIVKADVMPLILEACPSFRGPWKDYTADVMYEESLLYIHLGEFARHLVESMKSGEVADFPAVFSVIERLHLEGDSYVREAATVGLLEGIQNIAGNTGIDPSRFAPYLSPETARWWRELDAFWDAKSP